MYAVLTDVRLQGHGQQQAAGLGDGDDAEAEGWAARVACAVDALCAARIARILAGPGLPPPAHDAARNGAASARIGAYLDVRVCNIIVVSMCARAWPCAAFARALAGGARVTLTVVGARGRDLRGCPARLAADGQCASKMNERPRSIELYASLVCVYAVAVGGGAPFVRDGCSLRCPSLLLFASFARICSAVATTKFL
ncbi:hypothetical protein FA95DRAFT_1559320 [Auriscalpium vulgare]|uniref:Uncharacterized protein n=1 Tax=Auriscalpium vulgare TaxID=40419 RepID=A0ACB8RU02_9AGAM|nr:hypothetical protein FA95DRAFT_1559320 [Auriscalpium vulgare]